MANFKKISKEKVEIKFSCPRCNNEIKITKLTSELPVENSMAVRVIDMIGRDTIPQRCPQCGRRYDVEIYVKKSEYYVETIDIINRHRVSTLFEEEN